MVVFSPMLLCRFQVYRQRHRRNVLEVGRGGLVGEFLVKSELYKHSGVIHCRNVYWAAIFEPRNRVSDHCACFPIFLLT